MGIERESLKEIPRLFGHARYVSGGDAAEGRDSGVKGTYCGLKVEDLRLE